MKSKIEVRTFAIEQAVIVLGTGAPQKDVIEKARKIEQYIIGDAELPETVSVEDVASTAAAAIMRGFHGIGCPAVETEGAE